jgi:hypothetical protein
MGIRMQNHLSRHRALVTFVGVVMVLSAMGFMPSAHAQQSPTDAPGESDAMQTITTCVSEQGRLDVVLLIDESGSLKRTDPNNDRVVAAQSALETLASLTEPDGSKDETTVEVRIAGFSESYKPYGEWLNLKGQGASSARDEAARFATRNSGLDTDFATALSGVRDDIVEHTEKLKADGSTACPVLMMFTDGEYDIEPRSAPETKPYAPDLPLDVVANPRIVIRAGMATLCEDGGVMDQLRKLSVPTLTVAMTADIDPAGQSFIQALTTGRGRAEACGTPTSDSGQYLPAANLNEVLSAFNAVASEISGGAVSAASSDLVVCAGAICDKGRLTIAVDQTDRLVSTLVTSDAKEIELLIRPPADEAYFLRRTGSTKSVLISASTEATWLSNSAVRLDIEPSDAPAFGDWHIDLIDPAARTQAAARAQTTRYSDLFPEVLGTPAMTTTEELAIAAAIVNSDGERTEVAPTGARMTALVRDIESGHETPLALSPTDKGTFEGLAPVDADFGPAFEVDLALEVTTDLGTDLPRQTTTSSFELAPAETETSAAEPATAGGGSANPPLAAQVAADDESDGMNKTLFIVALLIFALVAIAWLVNTAWRSVFKTSNVHVAQIPILIHPNGELERRGELAGPMQVLPEDLTPLDTEPRPRSLMAAGLKVNIYLQRRIRPQPEGQVSSNTRLTGSRGRVIKGKTSMARIGLDLSREWIFELDEEKSLAATDIAHRGDIYGRLVLLLTPNHLSEPPDDYAASLENDLPKRAQEILVDARRQFVVDPEGENMLGFIDELRPS